LEQLITAVYIAKMGDETKANETVIISAKLFVKMVLDAELDKRAIQKMVLDAEYDKRAIQILADEVARLTKKCNRVTRALGNAMETCVHCFNEVHSNKGEVVATRGFVCYECL